MSEIVHTSIMEIKQLSKQHGYKVEVVVGVDSEPEEAGMETPFTFLPDQSPIITCDREQDARDRKFSIVTSCWRRVAMQKRGNNDMETQFDQSTKCLCT